MELTKMKQRQQPDNRQLLSLVQTKQVEQAAESLGDSDLQLRMALEFSHVAVWHWIQATGAITWSGPVKLVYGKPESEITNFAQFREMVHPDDRAALEVKFFESLSCGREYRAEFRIIRPAGDIRWLAGRGDVLRDERGLIYGISGANFDITAAKTAEQRLRESERSFRELADAMPPMVWTADGSGQHDYFNRRWFEYTGGTDFSDVYRFVHPDDFERVSRAWETAVGAARQFEYELRLRRASDGSYRWHLARAIPVRDESGSAVRWYGTYTDVEEFKRAQVEAEMLNSALEQRVTERSAELAESELRYRLLVDGVKDYAILLLDQEGVVRSWNKGAELLTGYQAGEILGRNFSIFYTEASAAAGEPKRSLEYAARQGRSHLEGWRVRQNGEQFWASAVITALRDADGEMCGFAKVIRDMTEQRGAEQLLISERKRAEGANIAKSAFLAAMSHEIRTPMNALLGMADLLWESELTDGQRHYVEIFRRAGSNLLTLINDILDLSKIESGNFALEKAEFNVAVLVEQVIEILKPKAESKSIELLAKIGLNSALVVVGDAARLQQILLNLIGNAIKFTHKGEVVVAVECHEEDGYGRLAFEIRDTGIGIPPDKLESIFQDFEQAETSTARRFGGTGLGLGISRRLAKLMGGEITVKSELGKGSTFSFHVLLPLGVRQVGVRQVGVRQDGLDAAGIAPALPARNLQMIQRRFRILAAEDSEDNRFLIEAYCQGSPFELTFVDDGRQAVSAFRAGEFDLVLMDVQMPVLDGLAATREIRAIEQANGAGHTPILALTANALSEDVSLARAAGCDAYLSKPISKQNFLSGLAPWLVLA
jgi:PAS domain S-box-containing protein